MKLPLALLFGVAALVAPALAGAADPVGPQACRSCHARAFELWSAGPHARAESGLGDQGSNPSCLSCHAPQKASGQAGVTCEACHGNGQYYAVDHVMRDPELARAVGLENPDEKSCRTCHDATSPSLDPFVFEVKKARIDHWSEDRAARKAAKPAGASAAPQGNSSPGAPATGAPAAAPKAEPGAIAAHVRAFAAGLADRAGSVRNVTP